MLAVVHQVRRPALIDNNATDHEGYNMQPCSVAREVTVARVCWRAGAWQRAGQAPWAEFMGCGLHMCVQVQEYSGKVMKSSQLKRSKLLATIQAPAGMPPGRTRRQDLLQDGGAAPTALT